MHPAMVTAAAADMAEQDITGILFDLGETARQMPALEPLVDLAASSLLAAQAHIAAIRDALTIRSTR